MIAITLRITVTAILIACGVTRASAGADLEKLLASYKRHTGELVKPLRDK